MLWMNEYEVETAVARSDETTNRGRAARHLQAWVDAINSISDGWPYWRPASKAAAKLMALVNPLNDPRCTRQPDATDAELKSALTPLKSFRTRHSAAFARLSS